MKGLIIKDMINLKKQVGMYFLFIIFYSLITISTGDVSSVFGILAIFAAVLPLTAMGYDEKAKWDKYALSMPISRNEIVISKYILGSIFLMVAFLIMAIISIIDGSAFSQNLLAAAVVLCIGFIYLAITIPVQFKYGAEKGRLIMLPVFFTPFAIVMFLDMKVKSLQIERYLEKMLVALPIITVILFILSIIISIRIYYNKEL